MHAKDRVVVSKIWITGYWLRSQLWLVTAANQWSIVEIELSNSGLETGLPAFQLPMLAKCYALPKRDLCIFVRHVCLRNPCLLWKSKLPLPTRSLRSLRAAARSTSSELFHQAHPFVAAAGKKRVLCKELNNCQDWAFSQQWVGSRAASQPFSCRCWQYMWRAVRTEISWKFFSTRVLNFCIAAAGKTCLMQRSSRCGHVVVVSKMCYAQHSDCVQDCALRLWHVALLQTNEQLPKIRATSLSAAYVR